MGQRACQRRRRPRPAEPPPFGPYSNGEKEKAAYYEKMRRNHSPRRPRPLVGPPAPSPPENGVPALTDNGPPARGKNTPPAPAETAASSCTSIVVVSEAAEEAVPLDAGCAGSEALFGRAQGWRAAPGGRSQQSCSSVKHGDRDGSPKR